MLDYFQKNENIIDSNELQNSITISNVSKINQFVDLSSEILIINFGECLTALENKIKGEFFNHYYIKN